MTSAAVRLIESLEQLIIQLKSTHKLWRSEEELDDSELEDPTFDDIKTQMSENVVGLSRSLSWFLGTISFNLVNITKDESADPQSKDETEEQKMARMLLESKVLSGGLENRFISSFSQETKDTLKPLFEIIQEINQDNSLLEHMKQVTETPEDHLLQAIMSKGKDEEVDLLIDLLQHSLETMQPMVAHARIGGPQGLRMNRVAFAVTIKFGCLVEDLLSCKEEVLAQRDMLDDSVKGPQRLR